MQHPLRPWPHAEQGKPFFFIVPQIYLIVSVWDKIILALDHPLPPLMRQTEWTLSGTKTSFPSCIMRHARQPCAAQHALYPEHRSKPLSKSGLMMWSIKINYCCHHIGEPLKTNGSPWIIAPALTRKVNVGAMTRKVNVGDGIRRKLTFTRELGHCSKNTFSCFWRAPAFSCSWGRKNPFRAWQIDKKKKNVSLKRNDRQVDGTDGNVIPWLTHLRERSARSWTLSVWLPW